MASELITDSPEFRAALHDHEREERSHTGRIASLLVDNLNASVHLRALLTDLFLIEQAGKSAPRES